MVASIPLDRLLAQGNGVIAVRDHPEHRRSLYRLVQSGRLTALLPGVLVPAEPTPDVVVRARAVSRWAPSAVITLWAAAKLTFWPDLSVATLTAALSRYRPSPHGYDLVCDQIPAEFVRTVGEIRVTAPALTALDLAAHDAGAAIERVLRMRLVSVADLDHVLEHTTGRKGNTERRRWVERSRRCPWSAAERRLHSLLRRARIEGWIGNAAVQACGVRYVVDVVFRQARVVIEVDGYEFHKAERQEQFHRDRRKWTDLTAAGWRVLHVTWSQLTDDPDWVLSRVRRVLPASRFRVAS